MGTRHLTCVFINGEYKVAQYGQFDGYPRCAGSQILSFLRGEPVTDRKNIWTDAPMYGVENVVYDQELFVKNLLKCEYLSHDEVDKKYGKELKDSDKMEKDYPCLFRNISVLALPYIQKNGGVDLINMIEFSGNSLSCEWTYVIDYDKNIFEVYKGFVKEDSGGRFAEFFRKKDKEDKTQYFPVKFVKSWKLKKLPSNKTFLKSF